MPAQLSCVADAALNQKEALDEHLLPGHVVRQSVERNEGVDLSKLQLWRPICLVCVFSALAVNARQ
jgi:hypothetical protein